MTSKHFPTDSENSNERLQIHSLLATTRKKSDFQRVQCVWLRLEFNMNSIQVGKITNLSPGSVRKIWSQYINKGKEALICKEKGGRRNFHMSPHEEKIFLSPFFKKAEEEGGIDIAEIKNDYESRIGQKVAKSTIYRLLKRHGWKKNVSRPHMENEHGDKKTKGMHNYWIQGCSQAILPKKSGNISQQWLNNTLNSMITQKSKP